MTPLIPCAIGTGMAARPYVRIALNVAIDGALAALAVPLARVVADPSGDWLAPALASGRRRGCLAAGRDCRSGCRGNSGVSPASTTCSAVAWSSALGAALLAVRAGADPAWRPPTRPSPSSMR